MRVIAAAAALALSACSVLDVTPDCPVGADITFSTQTSDISWTPACAVDVIQVIRNEDSALFWSANGQIRSPIRYGTVAGSGGMAAQPLKPGDEYAIFLIRETDIGTQIGRGTFIAPFPAN